jgi:hypothetical protein
MSCPVCKKQFTVTNTTFRLFGYRQIRCSRSCYIAAMLNRKSPNKAELALLSVVRRYGFKFVGNGMLMFGTRNPDFANTKRKKVIELFGDYWHGPEKTGRSRAQEVFSRVDHYAQFGYSCLVVWYSELGTVEQKIRVFTKAA